MKAPKVKNMSKMFYNCPSLKTVNLSGLDAPELTNMSGMFAVDGKKIIIRYSNDNSYKNTSNKSSNEE